MKEHIKAILAKFVIVTLVLYLVLGLGYDVSLADVLMMSVLLTVIAYLLGDLVILPQATNSTDNSMVGNLVATFADFGLVLLSVWAIGRYLVSPYIPWFTAALISAVFIALGEMLFHRYLRETVIGNKRGL